MFRFILVGLVWLVCVGGVAFYMHTRDAFQDSVSAQSAAVPDSAEARFDLELTLTFTAEPDPFALTTGDSQGAGALPVAFIRLNDTLVAELHEGIAPGVPWLKENIEGVVVGTNELFVEATPPVSETGRRHAARVRLINKEHTLADQTFWTESGEKVTGTIRFKIAPDRSEADHAH